MRVHGAARFNITNFAQFENIEFVGVDNLVKVVPSDNDKKDKLYAEAFKYVPFQLCNFTEEATSYLETPKLKRLQGTTFNYTCEVASFNATANNVTNQTDTLCDASTPTTI